MTTKPQWLELSKKIVHNHPDLRPRDPTQLCCLHFTSADVSFKITRLIGNPY